MATKKSAAKTAKVNKNAKKVEATAKAVEAKRAEEQAKAEEKAAKRAEKETKKQEEVKEQELPMPSFTTKTNEAEFRTEIGNFVSLAVEKTRTAEDYIKVLHITGKSVAGFTKVRNISRGLGKISDTYLSAVGGTTGIPVSHIEIAPSIAAVLEVKTEVEKATEEHPQRFHFTGSQFNTNLLDVVLRYILVTYDKLSRKYIDSLTCTTAEKRELRKEYTANYIANTISALAEELGLTKEFVDKALDALKEQKQEKPKRAPKKEKEPKKSAQQVADDGFEEEPGGKVVYQDEDPMESVVAERSEEPAEAIEAPEETTEVVEVPQEVVDSIEDELE